MRLMGFSTGALALSNFNKALSWLYNTDIKAIELSALRVNELEPLVRSLDKINVSQFTFVSVHAPSKYTYDEEKEIASLLSHFVKLGWPIIAHPDSIHSWNLWRKFGSSLFIENMDNRKAGARDAAELAEIFNKLPEAKLCFDIGHARQHDTTMWKALQIVLKYRSRLGQIHISEVDTNSKHLRLSSQAIKDYQKITRNIPIHIPVILETPVEREEMLDELKLAENSLMSCYISKNIKVLYDLVYYLGKSERKRHHSVARILYFLIDYLLVPKATLKSSPSASPSTNIKSIKVV